MTWNKITRLVRKRRNVTKSFFSPSLSQVISVWYYSKQLLSFPSNLSSVSNNEAVFVKLDTASEDLTYSKDNIGACNYSFNANGIVNRMKRNTTAVNFEFIRRAWHKTTTTKGNISRSLHCTQSTSPHYFIERNFEDILSCNFLDKKIYLRVSVHEM